MKNEFFNTTEEITELNDEHSIVAELDYVISKNEIINTERLKREKSHAIDLLRNEYFIESKDFLVPVVLKLFNRILSPVSFQICGQSLL